MRGVTAVFALINVLMSISTHTPHARRDVSYLLYTSLCIKFQLTRLMRGVTAVNRKFKNQNGISTHTPHARRDQKNNLTRLQAMHFNSHASCEA